MFQKLIGLTLNFFFKFFSICDLDQILRGQSPPVMAILVYASWIRPIDNFRIMVIVKLCKSRLNRQIHDVISLYCNAISEKKGGKKRTSREKHFNKKLIFISSWGPYCRLLFVLFFVFFFSPSFVLFLFSYWMGW